jgi:hypothetical protein
MDDPDVLKLLRSIDRRLALLTGKEERDVRRALVDEILTTPARTAMWDAIDGRAGSPELATVANVSDRAAQLFVKDLLNAGFVNVVTSGRGTVVEKNDDAIVRWYLDRVGYVANPAK